MTSSPEFDFETDGDLPLDQGDFIVSARLALRLDPVWWHLADRPREGGPVLPALPGLRFGLTCLVAGRFPETEFGDWHETHHLDGRTAVPTDPAAEAALRLAFDADCAAMAAGFDPLDLPLWPAGGNPFQDEWAVIRTEWVRGAPGWDVWVAWYQALLTGAPLDWQGLRDVALIPDVVWRSGEAAVARAIEQLRGAPQMRTRAS